MGDRIIRLKVEGCEAVIYPDGSWKIRRKARIGHLPVDGGNARNPEEAEKAVRQWEHDHR